jgi:hypothetical protein
LETPTAVAEGQSGGEVAPGKPHGRATRARRLATFFTAAAFHNRRLGGLLEPRTGDPELSTWADAWDRVASLVRDANDERALRRLAAQLEREAELGTSAEWRAVCAPAEEIERLAPRRLD